MPAPSMAEVVMEEKIRVLILRPLTEEDGTECTLTEELIDNTAEALHQIVGNYFDIGTPFPSITTRLRAVVGDTAAFTEPCIFYGECQPWWGVVVFCHEDGPDLASLTMEEREFLKIILPQICAIRG